MATVTEASAAIGVAPACEALGVPRATYYRHISPKPAPPCEPTTRTSHRALNADERAVVLAALHEPRFVDKAPAEVYATLLDEERYLCSERTMYRILAANGEVRERRNQLRHPNHPVPQLHATAPRQLWTWDITKLLGPAKWTYFYLYVILDVFSRYVVGWMVAHEESSALAQRLIDETCERQGVLPGQLTIHADRGSSMTSKGVALLMADLGITKTHSRPYVSNDNPFSEAQFKTLKYAPAFPGKFGCLQDARAFLGPFFDWYNNEHRHSALELLTPSDVHFDRARERLDARNAILKRAYRAHPERFPRGLPNAGQLDAEVWINPPIAAAHAQQPDPTNENEVPPVAAGGAPGRTPGRPLELPTSPPEGPLPMPHHQSEHLAQ